MFSLLKESLLAPPQSKHRGSHAESRNVAFVESVQFRKGQYDEPVEILGPGQRLNNHRT